MFLFWLIIVAFLAYIIINFRMDENAPEETVNAKLVKKEVSSYCPDPNQGIINTDYILTFDIGGKRKIFATTYSVYEQYEENQTGKLTYKRNKFVNFVVE